MKSTKGFLAVIAATLIAPAFPTMANSGLIKVTVASDTPYRQSAASVAVASSEAKFQIAPVKMQVSTPATVAPATVQKTSVHPRWR